MTHWKLHRRILMLVLLPGLIVSVFLGSYLIAQRINDLDLLLEERGLAIAKQAAPTCEYGVVSGNLGMLQNIANNILEERDLRAISILNKDGKELAHAGPKMIEASLGHTELKNDQLQLSRTKDTIRIKAPIYAQTLTLPDQVDEQFYLQQDVSENLLGWAEIEMSLANTRLAKYQHLATSITIVVTVLIICLVMALRMSRNISRPIELMVDAIDDIGDGKLDTRVHLNSGDEFQTLASGINGMANAIQRSRAENQQNIEQVTADMRETMETIEIQNIELDIARKEALEGSRIKSEFLANISHEIRTPLNGIIGFTQLLQKTHTDLRQKEYLNTIEKSADGLLTIINDILDLSKIDAGKLVLENIEFNLREIVEDVLTITAPEAHKKSLELTSMIYSDVPLALLGDPLRIKQVLTNLISNAIKFTEQGSVTLRVMILDESQFGASLNFEVSDTGIGLNNEQKEKLFHAFTQADSSTARQFGGTGLGLVISQHLVKAMQGDIGVESEEGQGATFSFSVELQKSEQQPRSMTDLQDHSMLLYETASTTRLSVSHLLDEWRIRYSDTDTPDILLQSIARKQQTSQPVDAIIVGLSRQELYAQETTQLFKQLNGYNIPVIALINSAVYDELEYIQALGAYHGLAKPLESMKLYNTLCSALNKQIQQDSSELHLTESQGPVPVVLAVDDNEANLKLVVTLLEELGVQVLGAASGPEALTMMEESHTDLIFMDIQMPGMNGLETTQLIRQKHTASQLPVIALTAHAIADEKEALLKVGMNDYQTKPISSQQLQQCIEKWTGYRCPAQPHHHMLPDTPASRHNMISHPKPEKTLTITDNSSDTKAPACDLFDAKAALRLANNKADLATDMFRMLLNSLQSDISTIRDCWQQKNQEGLLEVIHKVHGATRYCGTPCLLLAMEQLESQLKSQSLEQCEDHYQRAVAEINSLMNWAKRTPWQEELKELCPAG